jgi:hypothetical protein
MGSESTPTSFPSSALRRNLFYTGRSVDSFAVGDRERVGSHLQHRHLPRSLRVWNRCQVRIDLRYRCVHRGKIYRQILCAPYSCEFGLPLSRLRLSRQNPQRGSGYYERKSEGLGSVSPLRFRMWSGMAYEDVFPLSVVFPKEETVLP